MKCYNVIVSLEKGGAETQLSLLATSRAAGTSHVISFKQSSTPLAKQLVQRGVPVDAMSFDTYPGRSFLRLVRFLRLHVSNSDMVQCWMYHANLIGFLAALLAGRRKQVVWNLRRTAIPGGMTGWVSRICGFISRHVDVPIVCCAQAALESHCRAGYRRDHMVVIHNGIDIGRFQRDAAAGLTIRQELAIAADAFVLGMVARYAPVKGHLYLLQALTQLADRLPDCSQFKVVLVGRGVLDAAPLKPYLNDPRLQPYLVLVPETDQVPRYLSAFDALCMPSESEGFPNVVAEAMACEVVPLVTDVGEAKVIVGNEGLVVPPFNPELLANAIVQLLAMPASERRQMAARARMRIAAMFSVEEAVRKYDALYRSLLNK